MKKHELLGEILKINAHFPILENYSISHIIIHFHVFFIRQTFAVPLMCSLMNR